MSRLLPQCDKNSFNYFSRFVVKSIFFGYFMNYPIRTYEFSTEVHLKVLSDKEEGLIENLLSVFAYLLR